VRRVVVSFKRGRRTRVKVRRVLCSTVTVAKVMDILYMGCVVCKEPPQYIISSCWLRKFLVGSLMSETRLLLGGRGRCHFGVAHRRQSTPTPHTHASNHCSGTLYMNNVAEVKSASRTSSSKNNAAFGHP
jgi:hypothetical protein